MATGCAGLVGTVSYQRASWCACAHQLGHVKTMANSASQESNISISRGRPKIHIDQEQVEFFCMGDLKDYSDFRQRRAREWNIPTFSTLMDSELDGTVVEYMQQFPNCWEAMLRGYLYSTGLHVQRRIVRESIYGITGWQASLYPATYRHTYSVPGSNHLWHVDGNHNYFAYQSPTLYRSPAFYIGVLHVLSDTYLSYQRLTSYIGVVLVYWSPTYFIGLLLNISESYLIYRIPTCKEHKLGYGYAIVVVNLGILQRSVPKRGNRARVEQQHQQVRRCI